MRAILVFLLAATLPSAAFAHPGMGDAAGLLHGFSHPIGGLDHVLAMVAVGVFAAVLGGRALWMVPLAFIGAMVMGFLLGAGHVDLPFVELAIALSSIVIGGAAALGRPMPLAGAMALVGVFAVFHGHAHGAEMPSDAGGVLYAAGFVAATGLLHGAGIGAATIFARLTGRLGKPLAQVAGALFAAGGFGVLVGWL